MPPTVAQTAPAFADAAGEGIGAPGANVAYRAEYEDRSVALVKLLPVAQDFHDELHGYKNVDARALFQQLEDDWTRRVLLPVPPNAYEDWSWSRDFSLLCVKPFDAEPIDFARPIVTLLAYDENDSQRRWEWLSAPQTTEQDLPSQPPNPPAAFADAEESRNFTERRFWLDGDALLSVPLVPSTAWLEENGAGYTASSGSLAAMVMLDEFVNAPAGGNTFGPASRGRSVRFGFSNSSFR
jgi:hypothetical protein